MSEQVVPSAVEQSITAKCLTNENVKPADILKRLRAQFAHEYSKDQSEWLELSHLKKAEQGMRICENEIFCRLG